VTGKTQSGKQGQNKWQHSGRKTSSNVDVRKKKQKGTQRKISADASKGRQQSGMNSGRPAKKKVKTRYKRE
jgi:hypothetical protein